MAWVLLLLAGAFEICWALALKESDGLSRLVPSLVFLAAAVASIALLMIALRDLPVGTAYAVWTGVGAAGTAIFGMLILSESASVPRILAIMLIVAGVAGLYLFESD